MATGSATVAPASAPRRFWPRLTGPSWMLAIGVIAISAQTLTDIARMEWTTEQGSFGPIVLLISIWLFFRHRATVKAAMRPGDARVAALILVPTLLLYVLARATGFLLYESIFGYAALIAVAYLFVGMAGLRAMRFPIAYGLLVLPIATHLFYPASQPIRMLIGKAAIGLLAWFGYHVGQDGLTLYVDQYELAVQEACSGFNSIISLTAIGIFYLHVRRDASWRMMLAMLPLLIALAIAANFVRIVILILLTHYAGDGVAQGFLHGFSGMTTFAAALLGFIAIDAFVAAVRR